MAMLAEPRQRKRYNLVPRGKALYEDDTRFGTKMLEKMGWSKGKGLGANLEGEKDFVRIKYKNDSNGLGFEDRDDQWTQHENSFNSLLKSLDGGNGNEKEDVAEVDTAPMMGFGFKAESKKETIKDKISGKSLEEKSKNSKARVHYKKFTRGKDVARYSEKDLANIFGKKVESETPFIPFTAIEPTFQQEEKKEEAEKEDKNEDNNEEEDKSARHGVTTIATGLSIEDYFRQKMEARKLALAGGKAVVPVVEEKEPVEEEVVEKKKKSKKRTSEEEAAVKEAEEAVEEPKKKKKSKKKENSSSKEAEEQVEKEKSKKKKKSEEESSSSENSEQVTVVEEPKEKKKKDKKRKPEETKPIEEENSEWQTPKSKKKKKKDKHAEEEVTAPAAVQEDDGEWQTAKTKKKKNKDKEEATPEALPEAQPTPEQANTAQSTETADNNKIMISAFCAEKFRHTDLKAFEGANISDVVGYGLKDNFRLEIRTTADDNEKIAQFYEAAALEQQRKVSAMTKYIDKVKEARKAKKPIPKMRAPMKRKHAFGGL